MVYTPYMCYFTVYVPYVYGEMHCCLNLIEWSTNQYTGVRCTPSFVTYDGRHVCVGTAPLQAFSAVVSLALLLGPFCSLCMVWSRANWRRQDRYMKEQQPLLKMTVLGVLQARIWGKWTDCCHGNKLPNKDMWWGLLHSCLWLCVNKGYL